MGPQFSDQRIRVSSPPSEPPAASTTSDGSDVTSHLPTVGERIATVRRSRGLNRNQLAREVGTTWAVVNRWEKDRTRPSIASLHRLADVLKVSMDELIGSGSAPRPMDDAELTAFLRWHAPGDLSDEELRWLRSAPVGGGRLYAGDFSAILRVVRECVRRRGRGDPA